MIDLSKKYRHVDGYDVELYAIKDGLVMGAMKYTSGWNPCSWRLETDQLVEVKTRQTREGWVNIYEKTSVATYIHDTKRSADVHAGSSRIACIKVELDFEDGEGL